MDIIEKINNGNIGLFGILPLELRSKIVYYLDPKTILILCQTYKEFNEEFCEDPEFWRRLFERDFNFDLRNIKISNINYRNIYINATLYHYLNQGFRDIILQNLGIPSLSFSGNKELYDILINKDLKVFNKDFNKSYNLTFSPMILTSQQFEELRNLLRLLYGKIYILKYRGFYYIPRNISYLYIGLTKPAPGNNLPIPCAMQTFKTAKESVNKFNKEFNTNAEFIEL